MSDASAWPESISRLQGLVGSVNIAQRGLIQATGAEIFAGVFSSKFILLFQKTREKILALKKGYESSYYL